MRGEINQPVQLSACSLLSRAEFGNAPFSGSLDKLNGNARASKECLGSWSRLVDDTGFERNANTSPDSEINHQPNAHSPDIIDAWASTLFH